MGHREEHCGFRISDCGFEKAKNMEHGGKDRGRKSEVRGQKGFQALKFQVKSGSSVTNEVFHPDP